MGDKPPAGIPPLEQLVNKQTLSEKGKDENSPVYYKPTTERIIENKNLKIDNTINEIVENQSDKEIETMEEMLAMIERNETGLEELKEQFDILKELLEEVRLTPVEKRTPKQNETIDKLLMHGKWIARQLAELPKVTQELKRILQEIQLKKVTGN